MRFREPAISPALIGAPTKKADPETGPALFGIDNPE